MLPVKLEWEADLYGIQRSEWISKDGAIDLSSSIGHETIRIVFDAIYPARKISINYRLDRNGRTDTECKKLVQNFINQQMETL